MRLSAIPISKQNCRMLPDVHLRQGSDWAPTVYMSTSLSTRLTSVRQPETGLSVLLASVPFYECKMTTVCENAAATERDLHPRRHKDEEVHLQKHHTGRCDHHSRKCISQFVYSLTCRHIQWTQCLAQALRCIDVCLRHSMLMIWQTHGTCFAAEVIK